MQKYTKTNSRFVRLDTERVYFSISGLLIILINYVDQHSSTDILKLTIFILALLNLVLKHEKNYFIDFTWRLTTIDVAWHVNHNYYNKFQLML